MGLKIVVIGGGSSYTQELMNRFIRRQCCSTFNESRMVRMYSVPCGRMTDTRKILEEGMKNGQLF